LIFQRGHDVGYFAQQLFPGGINASAETANAIEAAKLTGELILQKTHTIYEATFIYNQVLIMVDILHFDGEVYRAYEVKSSLKVSEYFLRDACLQYFVLQNSLQTFEDMFLVTVNAPYKLNGEIDPKLFFKKRSIKKEAEKNSHYFAAKIQEALFTLEQNSIPNIAIGKQCFKPYQCDFFGTCWQHLSHPESILNIPFVSKDMLFEWLSENKKDIAQLKESDFENGLLQKIMPAILSQSPVYSHENIGIFLNKIKSPFATIDMEIWAPAIPELQQTGPFEQIPFLFCVYDGNKKSHFFTGHSNDDRLNFAFALIDETAPYQSLIVYDKTMEEAAINNLIALYPHLEINLNLVKSKLVDAYEPIRNLDYYHPKFKGSFNLKVIGEVLLTDFLPGWENYEHYKHDKNPSIKSGLEAMAYFAAYRKEENEIEKSRLRAELIDYCENDALITYYFIHFLQKLPE
jgi:hypothetical protein